MPGKRKVSNDLSPTYQVLSANGYYIELKIHNLLFFFVTVDESVKNESYYPESIWAVFLFTASFCAHLSAPAHITHLYHMKMICVGRETLLIRSEQ